MKFEIGQKVFDSFRYAGLEGTVKESGEWGVVVEYAGSEGDRPHKVMYQFDGRYITSDAFPTLYPFPYEIEVKEVSEFKTGEIILHRNNEAHPWNIGIYIDKSHGCHFVKSYSQFETIVNHVIKFKGNENKLWKTN